MRRPIGGVRWRNQDSRRDSRPRLSGRAKPCSRDLYPLHTTERFQRICDLRCPRRHLVVPQRALG
jgi:hypothetical protein